MTDSQVTLSGKMTDYSVSVQNTHTPDNANLNNIKIPLKIPLKKIPLKFTKRTKKSVFPNYGLLTFTMFQIPRRKPPNFFWSFREFKGDFDAVTYGMGVRCVFGVPTCLLMSDIIRVITIRIPYGILVLISDIDNINNIRISEYQSGYHHFRIIHTCWLRIGLRGDPSVPGSWFVT